MGISVIIVNYNGYKFLSRLIESIKKQTYHDFEIILVDNSSTDCSIKFVKQNYPHIKVLKVQNRGYGAACNAGAKIAKGNYLVFLNEDMYMPKDFLEKMMLYRTNLEKSEQNIGVVGCKIIPFDSKPEDTPEFYGGSMDILGFPSDNKRIYRDVLFTAGCPFFIKRKLFLSSKGFNENIFLYSDDVDYSWRLKLFGYNHYVNNDTYLYHYGGGVTGSFTPHKVAHILYGNLITITTNYSLMFLIPILPIYFIHLILINIGFLIITRFNIAYNIEIMKNFVKFIKNIKSILKMRYFVQNNRKSSDLVLIKYINPVPSIIRNLSYKRFLYKKGRA